MQFGIDRFILDKKLRQPLAGQRIALLGHPASMTRDFNHSLDALFKLNELNITSAFGPQHGMRGEKQDNMVESSDYIDPIYKIPVFSLYGEVRKPTDKMMDTFDIMLVDLQDVGTRIYTFLTTLLYVLEAGAKKQKTIWILDRPNPAGRPIEGSLLQPGWESFVGAGPIPMRHGLTLGEAANWFVKKMNLSVQYKVIEMTDYKINEAPGWGWPLNERSWVNPSPNAATLNMARCFPGTVMLEGTHLSEGRGTTRPLEVMGAPDISSDKVLKKMNELAAHWMEGALIRPCYFQPTFHKYAGQICEGFQIHTDHFSYQHEKFKPYRLVALFFKAIRSLYPEYQIWKKFAYEYEHDRLAIDLINGGPLLRNWVDDTHATVGDFEKILSIDEKKWLEERSSFLIYKEKTL